jgi:hypothetical protein
MTSMIGCEFCSIFMEQKYLIFFMVSYPFWAVPLTCALRASGLVEPEPRLKFSLRGLGSIASSRRFISLSGSPPR